jgi:hypothetical protein
MRPKKLDVLKAEFLVTHNLKRIENKDSIKQIEQKIAFISNTSNRKNGKPFFVWLQKASRTLQHPNLITLEQIKNFNLILNN